MPAKKKSGRRSEPKLFRCTGFGDCNMVFTRSEHLARHARKHTGEKPFKCIVPGCERMFSRFDNMMQHTHTHERQQQKQQQKRASSPQQPPAPPPPTRRRSSMVQTRQLPPLQFTPHPADYNAAFYPPPPSSPSNNNDYVENNNTRRLSQSDLQVPIHQLSALLHQQPPSPEETVADITNDEYEAIEGFGRFHAGSVLNKPLFDSPNIAQQVNAFRQNVMPVQESFHRTARSHAI